MARSLISIDDLPIDELEAVLARSAELAARPVGRTPAMSQQVLGLLFSEASLRTRAGFAVAAARAGLRFVEVHQRHETATASAESFEDTLRVAAGMVDLLVVRARQPLRPVGPHAMLNGGDAGEGAEHPTQALLDLFAMEWMGKRPVSDLTVALCGDLGMRTARSLLKLLARRPPSHLVLIHADGQGPDPLPPVLSGICERRPSLDLDEVDVLHVVGMPHRSLPLDIRDRFILGSHHLRRLRSDAIVLSPMPVIDEIEPAARADPRVRFLEQSDLGVQVRRATLEWSLDALP